MKNCSMDVYRQGFGYTFLDRPEAKKVVSKKVNQGLTLRLGSAQIHGHFKHKSNADKHLKMADPLQERAICLLLGHRSGKRTTLSSVRTITLMRCYFKFYPFIFLSDLPSDFYILDHPEAQQVSLECYLASNQDNNQQNT